MASDGGPAVGPAGRSDAEDVTLAVSLGRAIRILRTERGWSREELARRAGVSWSLVAHLENARRPLSFAVMVRLTDALGVSPSDLYARAEKINVDGVPSGCKDSRGSEVGKRTGSGDELQADDDEHSEQTFAELCDLMGRMSLGDKDRLIDLARRLAH